MLELDADFDALRWPGAAVAHFLREHERAAAAATPPQAGLLGWLTGAATRQAPAAADAGPAPTLSAAPPPAPAQLLSPGGLFAAEPAPGSPAALPAPGQADPQGAALLAAKMGRYAAECELLRHTLACARGVLLAVGDPPAASGPDPVGSTP